MSVSKDFERTIRVFLFCQFTGWSQFLDKVTAIIAYYRAPMLNLHSDTYDRLLLAHGQSESARGLAHSRTLRAFHAAPNFARVFWRRGIASALAAVALTGAVRAQTSDPLLNLLIKKGMVTQDEADQVKAELDASKTNNANADASITKWKISVGVKTAELFGDIRLRFEDRQAQTPTGSRVDLARFRYALRLGLRGDLTDDFYYGLRLETSSNPRSPWVTFGSSSTGVPYQGPFGKSTAGLNLGLIYLGWRPASWVDITVGKMPNPLYVTPMVWDSDYAPEGAAERFKYTVGDVDFFANLSQFLYADANPTHTGAFLFPTLPVGQDANDPFLLAYQGGFTYHITKDISFKAAGTLYNYDGTGVDIPPSSGSLAVPGFSDVFVGESSGVPVAGASGYPTGTNDGFTFNQTGINDLLIMDFPFELNFKIGRENAKFFGDFAENLEGAQRAEAAVQGALVQGSTPLVIPLKKYDNIAYQLGFAIGNGENLGLVYGSPLKKNTWEARVYWQHVEQYALDPNLLDSDFFEGRANLQGLYAACAYGFTDAMIGTVRYGYATRIDDALGTGGSNQDIPQVNPIKQYQLLQLDLTCKF
jgi:hypothetical protein